MEFVLAVQERLRRLITGGHVDVFKMSLQRCGVNVLSMYLEEMSDRHVGCML